MVVVVVRSLVIARCACWGAARQAGRGEQVLWGGARGRRGEGSCCSHHPLARPTHRLHCHAGTPAVAAEVAAAHAAAAPAAAARRRVQQRSAHLADSASHGRGQRIQAIAHFRAHAVHRAAPCPHDLLQRLIELPARRKLWQPHRFRSASNWTERASGPAAERVGSTARVCTTGWCDGDGICSRAGAPAGPKLASSVRFPLARAAQCIRVGHTTAPVAIPPASLLAGDLARTCGLKQHGAARDAAAACEDHAARAV